MANKKVKINVKVPTGYDTLFPKTTGEIVDFNKGKTDLTKTNVEEAIQETRAKGKTETENIKKDIGLLSSLKPVKTSIVNAINDLYDKTIGSTLKSLKDVLANSQSGKYVDAKAIKELNDKFAYNIGAGETKTGITSQGHEVYSIAYDLNIAGYSRPISISIPNANIDYVWIDASNSYLYGISNTPSAGITFPICYCHNGDDINFSLRNKGNGFEISILSNGNWANYHAWLVFKYYKK